MVSKIFFVVALSIAVFQVSDAKSALEDDFDHFVQPVTDAYETLKKQFQDVVDKIQENPIFKNAADTVNHRYDEAQKALFDTYDKLSTCRKLIFEQEPAGPIQPSHDFPQGPHNIPPQGQRQIHPQGPHHP